MYMHNYYKNKVYFTIHTIKLNLNYKHNCESISILDVDNNLTIYLINNLI